MEVTLYAEHTGQNTNGVPAVNVKQCGRFGDGLTPENLNCTEDVFHWAMVFAWDAAAARFWEDAGEIAEQHFGPGVRVTQAGRSGGWLLVHGMTDPAEWDDMTRQAWVAFETAIQEKIADLSSADHVRESIESNCWNEPGAEEYNFIDTAAGESRCRVDMKREAAAAPDMRVALEAIINLPADDAGERIIPAGFLDGARAALKKAGVEV